MNEEKQSKEDKNQKVGADGLTKKERRALKVSVNAKTPSNEVVELTTSILTEAKEKLTGKPNSEAKNNDKRTKKERRALKVTDKEKCIQNVEPDIKTLKNKPEISNKLNSFTDTSQIPAHVIATAETKSKAQLRAERREIQEKQRLAKTASKESKLVPKAVNIISDKSVLAAVKTENKEPTRKEPVRKVLQSLQLNQVQLFSHLCFKLLPGHSLGIVNNVHPSFIKLGAQYLAKTILGSNARCLALLASVKHLIDDFVTPPKQELCRSLETYLHISVQHLQKCRPMAVSMINALRHFKVHLTQVKTDLDDDEKKLILHKIIDDYIDDEIQKAGTAICLAVKEKICNGDVILTYGCSSLVRRILLDAQQAGKQFSAIIVDGRPLLEGREQLRRLATAGINCTYVLIHAVSHAMMHTSKVLLGAHALLTNGHVTARTGTAQVALVAHAHGRPVLVCCETYKFSERAQTDSFVYNEIGDTESISVIDTLESVSTLKTTPSSNYLTPLNLMYDVTPPDLVTAVVTELGFLPCTSVPVILRIKPTE